MDIDQIKKYKIPETPGCYLYFNGQGEIIYVGKAVNLKSRVFSYWRRSSQLTPAKEQMLREIAKVKWMKTESEVEAFLLEANLIKKYQPKYNISARDDKRFLYIKVSTEEEWPRIFATRTLDKAGKYFGPYTSAESVRETLKLIRRIWPYRSCARMPGRVCLYYHVGKCPGACEEKISRKEYWEYIRQVIRFLQGRKKDIVADIKREVRALEKELKEKNLVQEQRGLLENKSNLLNYRLFNIERVLEMSRVLSVGEKYANDVLELAKLLNLPRVPERIEGYDISNIFGKEAVGSMVVFSAGEPVRNGYRKFRIKANEVNFNNLAAKGGDVKMLEEVLERRFRRYDEMKDKEEMDYKKNWSLPDLIIIDGGKAQLNVALRVLKRHNLEIPAIGISKGLGLRSAKAPDKLFFAGEKTPLELPLASPALHLIKRVRDEAHRFAISYHKFLRQKRFLS